MAALRSRASLKTRGLRARPLCLLTSTLLPHNTLEREEDGDQQNAAGGSTGIHRNPSSGLAKLLLPEPDCPPSHLRRWRKPRANSSKGSVPPLSALYLTNQRLQCQELASPSAFALPLQPDRRLLGQELSPPCYPVWNFLETACSQLFHPPGDPPNQRLLISKNGNTA